MLTSYAEALRIAVQAARVSGEILRTEFHRPGGPRGRHDHAPVDVEAETAIRERLLGAFPSFGFRGEETGFRSGQEPIHVWVVDPNDGTSAFVKGFRGSSVSIALLREGIPILGVVYAFAAPDDDGDLFAWAEGCGPLTRNGQVVNRPPWPGSLGEYTVALVSHRADRNPAASARCAAPGRFRKVPGIAYRLALVAAGEADACVSLSGPGAVDYAAGHALLRGVGGAFLDQSGWAVVYSPDGRSYSPCCFGGAPGIVEELVRRPWNEVLAGPKTTEVASIPGLGLVALEPGRAVEDVGLLRRAQGCLLGQIVGDALGGMVEFQQGEAIRRSYPEGVRELQNGGHWHTLAGQPTDDSELALMLARSMVAQGKYDREVVASAYRRWYDSDPFDIGFTTSQALGAATKADVAARRAAERMASAASTTSQANGSLMRISPLGIWGHRLPPDELAGYARADSALTHPHPVCRDACAVITVAVARAIATGGEAATIYQDALAWAEAAQVEPRVLRALRFAAERPPIDYQTQQGWVLIALQNAFYRLLHAASLEEGVVQTVMAGGDTDTNAAIAGALLGAVHGREAVPFQWRQMVLSCRPLKGMVGSHHPRPTVLWPVDALELAERLLLVHSRANG
ncbi:MAG: ADP-ribosylglycohydrolase family protein [Chloroflexi bacterium]|nr:ADP-ribosylglycohydrolase family protein [Chloroflexota bacterium]